MHVHHIYSDISYKKYSTVRAGTPSHSAMQRKTFIMTSSASVNKEVLRLLNFTISISKSARGGEGSQKASGVTEGIHLHPQGKRRKKTLENCCTVYQEWQILMNKNGKSTGDNFALLILKPGSDAMHCIQ